MFSYVESRGGEYPETLFFGLQYYLKEYLSKPITVEEVGRAKALFEKHGVPFNYEGWMYIAKDLKGKLPVIIRAVPEGTVLPTLLPLVTIESTDPKVFWIVSWLETSLLRNLWYPINVATRSYTIKKIIMAALEKSSDDPGAEIAFKLHDFGSRGVSSQESAMIGGAAHLVNFQGSDTIVGVHCANEYYHSDMAGFSIPAAEHSSITSWGKDHEEDAYRNMLTQFAKPGSLLAVVSDSYDIYNAVSNLWGDKLKEEVIASGATVVIRPDSGNPPEVVTEILKRLDAKFGSTVNKKGFKVLNNVRVIQGDGINEHSIKEIIEKFLSAGYSQTNVAFGMGGALLQQHNRDTLKFAMKCSHIMVGEKSVNVFKNPVTDPGKVSKSGRLDLISGPKGLETVRLDSFTAPHNMSVMREVYRNGEILVDDNFEAIRARAK
jgi:nicotinamide phosphoribosyltransferase